MQYTPQNDYILHCKHRKKYKISKVSHILHPFIKSPVPYLYKLTQYAPPCLPPFAFPTLPMPQTDCFSYLATAVLCSLNFWPPINQSTFQPNSFVQHMATTTTITDEFLLVLSSHTRWMRMNNSLLIRFLHISKCCRAKLRLFSHIERERKLVERHVGCRKSQLWSL